MPALRFAVFGAGFWSRFQLAAWREVGGAKPVAIYNRTRAKAEAVAQEFGIPAVYDDPEELLGCEEIDFLDIITAVETHSRFVHLAAEHGVPAICQKPMATSCKEAEAMVAVCRNSGVPFMVHENWRWQHPIRELRKALQSSKLGPPFRARIQFCSSFPVFDNQPFLKELPQFILADMGSHILDTARFLFGEAHTLYCQTARIRPDIAGEDAATVVMKMGNRRPAGTTVICELSYASRTEHERFPQTFVLVECERGAVELAPDYWLRITTEEGTFARRCPPPRYAWADPTYDLVHASIVAANADLLRSIRTGEPAETSGDDNLKTARLVFAAYESAEKGEVVDASG